jgi:hypothetical protein
VLSFGRVDVPVQPASAVTIVEVPIQPGKFILFSLSFFLPMISRDHSLVFFSAISMKHALSCAVRSKKR